MFSPILTCDIYIYSAGVRPYKCSQCDKAFTQRCSLESHCRKIHGLSDELAFNERRVKLYVCEDCGHSTDLADDHYSHMRHAHPPRLVQRGIGVEKSVWIVNFSQVGVVGLKWDKSVAFYDQFPWYQLLDTTNEHWKKYLYIIMISISHHFEWWKKCEMKMWVYDFKNWKGYFYVWILCYSSSS